jgi:glycerol uptake facilitator-like aquaporin
MAHQALVAGREEEMSIADLRARRVGEYWGIVLAAAFAGGLTLLAGMIHPVNDDETYHLQYLWLTGHGYVPYRDFYAVHPPGLWLLLSPLAWLPSSPAQFLIWARVLQALLFGLTVWIAGRLIRARGWQCALLGVLAAAVMVDTQWFLVRVIYVEAFLVMLHWWLLDRMDHSGREVTYSYFAAIVVGLVCTISARGAFFLPLQPLFLLVRFRHDRRQFLRTMAAWVLGGVTASIPTVLYLTAHGLWGNAWAWLVAFPRSVDDVRFRVVVDQRTAALVLLGAVGLVAIRLERRLAVSTRQLIAVGWLVALGYYLAMPLRTNYQFVHIYVPSMFLAAIVPFVVIERLHLSRRGMACLAGAGVIALAVVLVPIVSPRLSYYERMSQKRESLLTQLRVLNWLHDVSAGQPVVCIDPYHPLLASNATYLRNSWQSQGWLQSAVMRPYLQNFPAEVLDQRPPVITAEAVPTAVGEQDLIQRLRRIGILDDKQAGALRRLVESEYVKLTFPRLSSQYEVLGGSTFWVRTDRVKACVPPEPYRLGN